MPDTAEHDAWSAGQSYDRYMGRWSGRIALEFLDWLNAPNNADWIDIGCGTGALTRAILDSRSPNSVLGIEPSEGFAARARESIASDKVQFETADAEALPADDKSVDVSASALVLNFVPDKIKALREMQRVTRPGGIISFYVWDYPGGGMGFIDEFWKAAAEVDPKAMELDEGKRFPFCTMDGLAVLCDEAGVAGSEIRPIEIETVFPTFEDFWQPFTLGAGPAPGYYMSLDSAQQKELQNVLTRNIGSTEPVTLKARAWAMKAANA